MNLKLELNEQSLSYVVELAMFVIVAFDDTNETDFVPACWIADGTRISNIVQLAKNRAYIKCYWPPTKNATAVSRAQNQSVSPDVNWPTYMGRILGTAGKKFCIFL